MLIHARGSNDEPDTIRLLRISSVHFALRFRTNGMKCLSRFLPYQRSLLLCPASSTPHPLQSLSNIPLAPVIDQHTFEAAFTFKPKPALTFGAAKKQTGVPSTQVPVSIASAPTSSVPSAPASSAEESAAVAKKAELLALFSGIQPPSKRSQSQQKASNNKKTAVAGKLGHDDDDDDDDFPPPITLPLPRSSNPSAGPSTLFSFSKPTTAKSPAAKPTAAATDVPAQQVPKLKPQVFAVVPPSPTPSLSTPSSFFDSVKLPSNAPTVTNQFGFGKPSGDNPPSSKNPTFGTTPKNPTFGTIPKNPTFGTTPKNPTFGTTPSTGDLSHLKSALSSSNPTPMTITVEPVIRTILPWDWYQHDQGSSKLDGDAQETLGESEKRAKALLELSVAASPSLRPLPTPYLQPAYPPTAMPNNVKPTNVRFIQNLRHQNSLPFLHVLASTQIGQMAFNSLGDLFITAPSFGLILQVLIDGTLVRIFHPTLNPIPSLTEALEDCLKTQSEISGLAIDFENRLFTFKKTHLTLVAMDLSTNSTIALNTAQGAPTVHVDGPLSTANFGHIFKLEFTKRGDLIALDARLQAIRIIKSVPHGSGPSSTTQDLSSRPSTSRATLELQTIAKRRNIGTITPESMVYTLCSITSSSLSTSFSLGISGSLNVLMKDSSFCVTRDGIPRDTDVSGDGIRNFHFEEESEFAVVLSQEGEVGLASLDPNTGRITQKITATELERAIMLTQLERDYPKIRTRLFRTNTSNNENDRGCIVPLPDRSGFLVCAPDMGSTSLSVVKTSFDVSKPLHPYSLSSMRTTTPSDSSLAFKCDNILEIAGGRFPLYEIVLQRRCPSLLKSETQEHLTRLSTHLPPSSFVDLFEYVYDDCLTPMACDAIETVERYIQLLILAAACDLEALVEYSKSRAMITLKTIALTPAICERVEILFQPVLNEHPFISALTTEFQSILIGQIPYYESMTFQADAHGVNQSVKEKSPSVPHHQHLVHAIALDPFGRLGDCFHDLFPAYGASLGTNGTDFEFIVNGHSVPCHALIIAARWSFFGKLLDAGLNEATERRWTIDWDWTPKGLYGFLRYLYTGYLDQLEDKPTCFSIVQQAEFLGLDLSSQSHDLLYHHCARISKLQILEAEPIASPPVYMQKDALNWLLELVRLGDQSQIEAAQTLVARQLPAISRNPVKFNLFETLPLSVRMAVLFQSHTAAHS